MRKTIVILFSLFLAACGMGGTSVNLVNVFDPDATSWFKQKGNSSISGQAFLRQRGGGVVTCAAEEVTLYPVTNYSEEVISAQFDGSKSKGYSSYYDVWGISSGSIEFDPPLSPKFLEYTQTTICDAQGNFTFKNLPGGREYYLISRVIWEVPDSYSMSTEGGSLMLRVTTEENENSDVVLTN